MQVFALETCFKELFGGTEVECLPIFTSLIGNGKKGVES